MGEIEHEEMVLAPPSNNFGVWAWRLSMGDSSGCDQQIAATLAPMYQLNKRGITFVASPRHANVVLLTGILTRASLPSVQQVLATVPMPHAIIAVGDGAINGGVFADSPQVIANASELLGANIEIAGDPPTPAQIIQAIEEAGRLLIEVFTQPTDSTADVDNTDDASVAEDATNE